MTAQTAAELRVELGNRSYDIRVGGNLIAKAGDHIAPLLAQPRAVVIGDSNTGPLYGEQLCESLQAAGVRNDIIVLPAGEGTKDQSHFYDLVERLLEMRVERRTTLIALGGGVIGDIVGFAAAVTLRGMPFIQVPTTLLSQVDSSVGGKTGINSKHGKNLIGAFYQPRLVLADIDSLNTLPERELRSGYAEVAKYGLIDDPDFFSWLEANGTKLIEGDREARVHAVLTSCQAKARVVAADEHESGQRALLNLGHTFGHALEAETGYGERLLHGEGVALGTVLAFDLSVQMGLCPAEDAARVRAHFQAVGLPVDIRDIADNGWTADRLMEHMTRDKKVKDGRVTFLLARGIGKTFIAENVEGGPVRALLEQALSR